MRADRALELVLAAGVLLPVLAAVWARPQRGLLLLVALLPFDGLLIIAHLPPAAAAWKEALVAVTLTAALQPGRGVWPQRIPSWLGAIALLATVALVTAAWTPPLQEMVGLKVAFFGLLPAVIALRCPLDRRDRDRLVTVLLATGCITAAVGLLQQAMGASRLNALGYPYNSVIRFTGPIMRSWSTFNQPFPFAFFLMLVLLVTLAVALSDPTRARSRVTFAVSPLLLAAMFFAVVRTAWIGLAVGAAYLAISRYRHLLRVAPLVAGAAGVAVLIGLAGFFASASAGDRVSRWQSLPAATAQAPFGHGAGSAGAAAAKADQLSGAISTYTPGRVTDAHLIYQPDNSYLEILFEDGVIGLALFLVVLQLLWRATRRAEGDDADGALAVGMSALVLAAVAASVASTFFEIFPMDYLFWLLAAVSSSSSSSSSTTDPSPARSLLGHERVLAA
jgi:hypothetical protein